MKVAHSLLIVLHHLSSLCSGGGVGSLGSGLFASGVLVIDLSNLTNVFVLLGSPGATLASETTAATSVGGVVVGTILAASLAASASTEASALLSP